MRTKRSAPSAQTWGCSVSLDDAADLAPLVDAAFSCVPRAKAAPAIVAAVAAAVFALVHLGMLSDVLGPPQAHAYASVVWTLAGFCALHLLVAAVLCLHVSARVGQRLVDVTRPLEWRVAHAFLRYALLQAAIGWAVIHLFPVLQ